MIILVKMLSFDCRHSCNSDNVAAAIIYNHRFRRKKKDGNMVDLTQKWYLVYGSGPMSE